MLNFIAAAINSLARMEIKLQNTKFLGLVIAIIIMVNVKIGTGQPHTLQPHIVKQAGNSGCLTQQRREDTLQALRDNISDILSNYVTVPECGEGLWYRVAYLNMTDPTQECPTAWRLYDTSGVRACGRPVTSRPSCPAIFYPTGRQYRKVCGRVIGYQVATPGAFDISPVPSSLDDTYVDGVSITYGYPRSHIWTFAAGVTEGTFAVPRPDCPCSRAEAAQAPSYVGDNYYCESGNAVSSFMLGHLYSSDPLWDGKQCEGQCCSEGKSPPWFKVELPSATSDDIQVRICGDEDTTNEDTPIELIEIYVA